MGGKCIGFAADVEVLRIACSCLGGSGFLALVDGFRGASNGDSSCLAEKVCGRIGFGDLISGFPGFATRGDGGRDLVDVWL